MPVTGAMPLALRLAGAAGNLQGDCNLPGDCNLQACSAPSPSRWRLRRSRGRLCLTFAGKNQAWKGAASRFPPGRLARRERHRRSACCSRLLCSVTVPVLCCRLCLSFEEKTTMHKKKRHYTNRFPPGRLVRRVRRGRTTYSCCGMPPLLECYWIYVRVWVTSSQIARCACLHICGLGMCADSMPPFYLAVSGRLACGGRGKG